MGHVFITKVYIDSNIEIEVKVIMYYFQSLKWERKTKKEHGLDFSFKYLQKRNIRKEKHDPISALILTLSRSWAIPNPPGMPSLARFARHLRLFTMPDQDQPPWTISSKDKTPYSGSVPPSVRVHIKRILSPYPLSFFCYSPSCKTPITKTVPSTAAPPHQPQTP